MGRHYMSIKSIREVISLSQPTFPSNPDITRDDAVNQILSSVAMEELGLSHIINAEGEKLQYILGTLPGITGPAATIEDVLNANESVQNLLQNASYNQLLLRSKMQQALAASEMTGATGPTGPAGPAGDPGGPTGPTGLRDLSGPLALRGCRALRETPGPRVLKELPVQPGQPDLREQWGLPEQTQRQPPRLPIPRAPRLPPHRPERRFPCRAVRFFQPV